MLRFTRFFKASPPSSAGEASDSEFQINESELAKLKSQYEALAAQLKLDCDPDERNYLETGLLTSEVEARVEAGLYNREVASNSPTEREILRRNIFTLFNILNCALALIVIFASLYNFSNLKNLSFIFVAIVNLAIGIYQELKAKRIVDHLKLLVEAKSLVWRSGNLESITAQEIVVDDLILLQNGEQIPVDCVFLAGQGFEVDESLISGESNSLQKTPGDPLYSGSFAVAGLALARVEKVGESTFAAGLSKVARTSKKKRSELKQSLFRIIQAVSVLIVPIGIALFLSQVLGRSSNPIDRILISSVAALVGMIPEGLILLTEIAFAVGVTNLSQKQVLVQTMPAIEMLARLDVLCLDKTGTLTSGRMRVVDLISLHGDSSLDCEKILASFVHQTSARGATQEALSKHFQGDGFINIRAVINFSSARKWSALEITDQGSYYLGAGEFILGTQFEAISAQVSAEGRLGRRVLCLVHSDAPLDIESQRPVGNLKPIALIIIEDEIREDAAILFRYLDEQGVATKLISGDHPKTLSAIARRAGLPLDSSICDLSTYGDNADYSSLAEEHRLFARANPYQKQALLHALKAHGHCVGMTGDGVNDVPALKDADCSIAMVSGSDAARGSADIVLLNDQLASLIPAVYEGRRVINNIERVASLFLVKTIYSCLLGILYIFIHAPYPVLPIQMSLVSSLTIGIPSFFLALKPNRTRVSGNVLDRVLSRALAPAIAAVLSLLCLQYLSSKVGLTNLEHSTVALVILMSIGFYVLYSTSIPLNIVRLGLIAGLFSGFLL
ncbi:MAG: HAD-IC family P-type ATPase, partial [Eubacteriales bacterium]|nr:HAD-IC family P-type ATPase [Eubacteriales bacterium]